MQIGISGPNDPNTREIECVECEGVGEVCVDPVDDVSLPFMNGAPHGHR